MSDFLGVASSPWILLGLVTLSLFMVSNLCPSIWGQFWEYQLSHVGCFIGGMLVIIVATLFRSKSTGKEPVSSSVLAWRQKTFPPSYPNGWYKLCNSSDIPLGAVKYFQACGQHLAVFRGKITGKVAVLDAFCPHLGANMAIGSKVEGDCLQCPFHLWEFDIEGNVTKIPYYAEEPPSNSKARCYPCEERCEMILFWFDAENREPLWRLPVMPQLEGATANMVFRGKLAPVTINMHIQDFEENGVDFAHFPALHVQMSIPWTHIPIPFIKIHHNASFEFDPQNPYVAYFRNTACLKIFGKDYPRTRASAVASFIGPGGIVPFAFDIPDIGKLLLFECHTPVDIMKTQIDFIWFAEPHIPRLLVSYVIGNWWSQWSNDIFVWENKIYKRAPVLLKTDGPVGKFRRWYQQNYSENSEKVARASSAMQW